MCSTGLAYFRGCCWERKIKKVPNKKQKKRCQAPFFWYRFFILQYFWCLAPFLYHTLLVVCFLYKQISSIHIIGVPNAYPATEINHSTSIFKRGPISPIRHKHPLTKTVTFNFFVLYSLEITNDVQIKASPIKNPHAR